ncbi:hypothetical protein FANTH_9517 [Fusarium anthophilum]|uniref:NB-ARC domain-containing protein n=1 Tax=Fusarium anthophilum TaxID=48485 RepID=A0A8H5DZ11_9HYPO|nr:hypothetical protein FANTH_9517 [Fusarium anthophilum]
MVVPSAEDLGSVFHFNNEPPAIVHLKHEPTPASFASIPLPRDRAFVDRGGIIDQISLQCSEPASRVAIVGLGGIGKSQLAIEFAYRFAARSAETWVFWIHASTQARVIEGFQSIADKVKLINHNRPDADVLQLVFDWLSDVRNGRWLLVLDSADDSDVLLHSTSKDNNDRPKLAEYLPQSPNGSILITTRNRNLAFRLVGTYQAIHEIGPMAQQEALMLLENRLGPLSDVNAAAELVRSLDFIPLAISQAAAYIQMRAPRTSLKQYLNEFRQSENKRVRLLSHEVGDLRRDRGASDAILTTWQMSFDHIRSRRPTAADLLSLMSFFDRQEIPESILRLPKDSHSAGQSIAPRDMTHSDSEGSGDESENEFEDNIAILRDYCLIMQFEESKTFEMHGLVQLSIRMWLKAEGLYDKFLEQYITVMASSFLTGNYENWTKCQPLLAHVMASVKYRPSQDNIKAQWSDLLHNSGLYAWLQGRYAVAEQLVSKARRTREKLLGKDHEGTLASTSLLASIYGDQDRWDEAEKLQVQVMETHKMKLGEDHLDTLSSMSNLASTYRNQGRWDEAEKLFLQALETHKMKLEEDHPTTLRSINNLALTYRDQGRWDEAEKLFLQALETCYTKLGEDHPGTLTSMSNLASTYRDQGRWEEAERLQVQVMETRKVKLGEDHPDTLTSMGNLASTYSDQGRWEEAEKLQMQVMETQKTKLGEDHPGTLTSMSNLASTYRDQGRWEEAEKLEVQVMETRKANLGEEHPGTLTSMSNLASTYRDQGRWEEAERLQVQVMETRKANLGEEHPGTLTSMSNLASTYRDQGRWEEAERLQVQVMETHKMKLGENHPSILTSMIDLAHTWKNLHLQMKAIAMLEDYVEASRQTLGPNHPDTINACVALEKWNQPRESAQQHVARHETLDQTIVRPHGEVTQQILEMADSAKLDVDDPSRAMSLDPQAKQQSRSLNLLRISNTQPETRSLALSDYLHIPSAGMMKIYGKIPTFVSDIGLREHDIAPGYQRVKWKNKRGKLLYDDYIEHEPGALQALQNYLNSSAYRSRSSLASVDGHDSGIPIPSDPSSSSVQESTSKSGDIVDQASKARAFSGLKNQLPYPQRKAKGDLVVADDSYHPFYEGT